MSEVNSSQRNTRYFATDVQHSATSMHMQHAANRNVPAHTETNTGNHNDNPDNQSTDAAKHSSADSATDSGNHRSNKSGPNNHSEPNA
jgi:hypothetical protein